MRPYVRFVCLIVPVALLSFVTLGAAPRSAVVVPKLDASLLSAKYPHWVPATVAPASGACEAAAAAAAPVITGDFDGDGLPDFVVQVQTGTTTHVTLILSRHDVPVLVDLDAPVGPFIVHKSGERYTTPDQQFDSTYFDIDTLGTDVCGSGDVWLFDGLNFKKTHVTR